MNYKDIYRSRKIWGGGVDYLQSYKPSKYSWLPATIARFKANDWRAESVKTITSDRTSFLSLSPELQRTFKVSLARVLNADRIQLDNLSLNLRPLITAQDIGLVIAHQEAEELNHTHAYLYIAEVVLPDPMEVEMMYLHVDFLAQQNNIIIDRNKIVDADKCPKAFAKLIALIIILEGILFYGNFAFFYFLKLTTKQFAGTCTNIQYINKDEDHHLDIHANIFNDHLKEWGIDRKEIAADIFEMFATAVKYEAEWCAFANNDGATGLTSPALKQFIEHRADACLSLLGYKENPFSGISNPFSWFYESSGTSLQRDDSFFQNGVTDYEHTNASVDDIDWS